MYNVNCESPWPCTELGKNTILLRSYIVGWGQKKEKKNWSLCIWEEITLEKRAERRLNLSMMKTSFPMLRFSLGDFELTLKWRNTLGWWFYHPLSFLWISYHVSKYFSSLSSNFVYGGFWHNFFSYLNIPAFNFALLSGDKCLLYSFTGFMGRVSWASVFVFPP